MNNNIFISIDGNNTGSIIQKYILSNELEKLNEFSSNLTTAIHCITKFIEKEKGIVYLTGGDNILAYIPSSNLNNIINIVKDMELKDFTFSIGIGNSSTDAYLALKYAKVSKSRFSIIYNENSFIEYKS